MGAGMAAAGFILFSFLVWPLWQTLGDTREAIASQQTILDQKKAVLDKMANLKKRVVAKQTEIVQLSSVLQAEKKSQDIVVNIEEMAHQSGMELRDFKTAEIISLDKNNGYQTLQVEIAGSGSYQSALELFKLLEKNLRVFDVQSFTVSLDTSSATTGKLNLNLKLLTYYLNSVTK